MIRKTINIARGETVRVKNEWAAEAESRDTSVASSVWDTTAGTLSGAALSSNLASVLLTEGGDGCLTNTVTLANGEVLVADRAIES